MGGVFNMRQDSIFKGVATALITPMDENGVNYQQLKELIDWQIEEGIDGLVICGTTGEGSTLSDAEHKEVLRFSAEVIGGRVPLIAGTGSNDTAYAIEMTEYACEVGADAMLVVTPYYNKTTQRGLVEMFNTIADASSKPIILYNVPSRTGINIEPETYLELAKHPMITAIKEANGDLSKIVETMSLMFIPAGVGLIISWNAIKDIWVQLVVIIIITTIAVMAVTGRITQRVIHYDIRKDERKMNTYIKESENK